MDRRLTRVAALLVLIAVAAGVALTLRGRPSPIVEAPTPQPSPQPSPQPTPQSSPVPRPRLDYTPVPEDTLSPIVVQRSPARGAELRPDGAIELVFDRPMDRASVESAFSLAPAV